MHFFVSQSALDDLVGISIIDTYEAQLAELAEGRFDGADITKLRAMVGEGNWVVYPWRNCAVRLLPEPFYSEVRFSRNRGKISTEEQNTLSRATIGFVGLSVGAAIAEVCAREGIGKQFRLADHDTVSLSNLNRLFAGVADLGQTKVMTSSHRLCELDPYLKVEATLGLNEENIERFIQGCDVIVEECDNLFVKLRVREVARAFRVPVIMETTDRGMLDVERFDVEPNRPLLHGLLGDLKAADVRDYDFHAKVELVKKILGNQVSAHMREAMAQVGVRLVSWPQLASDVALGASRAASAARSILLRRPLASGRTFSGSLEDT